MSFRRDSAKIESDDHVTSKDQLAEKDQLDEKDHEISEDLLKKKVAEILEESMEQEGSSSSSRFYFISILSRKLLQ